MDSRKVILVCVTAQQSSTCLVERAKHLSDLKNADLQIICVLPQRDCFSPDFSALVRLEEFAKQVDGQMQIVYNDSPLHAIVQRATELNPLYLVTGFPGKNSSGFIESIHKSLPRLPICMVHPDGSVYSIERVPGHQLIPFGDHTNL